MEEAIVITTRIIMNKYIQSTSTPSNFHVFTKVAIFLANCGSSAFLLKSADKAHPKYRVL